MSRAARVHAALAAIALGLLLAALTLFDIYGDVLMKRALRLAAIVAVAFPLLACAPTSLLGSLPAADRAAVLKGASEHIQKCDRKYWAKSGVPGSIGFEIDCKPSVQEQAEILARAVQDAVAKALAAAAAAPPPVSPK